jgi:hypothetical protein
MRLPRPAGFVALVGGAAAVAGALLSAPWPLGMGGVVTLTVLALHPAVRAAGPVRPALWAGLFLLGLAVLTRVRSLAVWQASTEAATLTEILALDSDPALLRARAARACGGAGFLLLTAGMFAVALRRRASRSALAGLGLLVVIAGAAGVSAFSIVRAGASTAQDVPVPPSGPVAPGPAAGLPPDAETRFGTAVVSVTTGVDPLGASATGLLLFGAYLVVNGSRMPGQLR